MKRIITNFLLALVTLFGLNTAFTPVVNAQTFVIARTHAAVQTNKPAASPKKAEAQEERVWINTNTNVYHNSGCRYYQNTKQGMLVTRTEAQNMGGRPCQKCGG